jgi:hypothetical protein
LILGQKGNSVKSTKVMHDPYINASRCGVGDSAPVYLGTRADLEHLEVDVKAEGQFILIVTISFHRWCHLGRVHRRSIEGGRRLACSTMLLEGSRRRGGRHRVRLPASSTSLTGRCGWGVAADDTPRLVGHNERRRAKSFIFPPAWYAEYWRSTMPCASPSRFQVGVVAGQRH